MSASLGLHTCPADAASCTVYIPLATVGILDKLAAGEPLALLFPNITVSKRPQYAPPDAWFLAAQTPSASGIRQTVTEPTCNGYSRAVPIGRRETVCAKGESWMLCRLLEQRLRCRAHQ